MTTPLSQDPDHLQARLLRVLLTEQVEELDATLATYGSALERYLQRAEHHTQSRRVRGLIRNAERERRSVQQMIAQLDERFGPAPHEQARRTGPAAARPAARVHPYPSPHRVIRA